MKAAVISLFMLAATIGAATHSGAHVKNAPLSVNCVLDAIHWPLMANTENSNRNHFDSRRGASAQPSGANVRSLFMKAGILSMLMLVSVAAAASHAVAPTEKLPMSKVVKLLESKGFAPIVDVSFDDGAWEVETYRGDEFLELTVDPVSGEVLSENHDDAEPRPPKDAKPLSTLLEELGKAGYSNIDDASFERRYWEIEGIRDNQEHEVHVDPVTGEVIADRIDD